MMRSLSTPLHLLVLPWVLIFPMLFFGARGMFSFDRAQYANNAAIGTAANSTVADSDTTRLRLERLAVYAIISCAMFASFRRTIKSCREHLSIFLLPAIALVSVLWSQDAVKTLELSILAFYMTAFAVYLIHRFSRSQALQFFNFVGMGLVLSSYVLIAFFPSIGIRAVDGSLAWQGLFVHKNHLGIVMVFFVAAAYYTKPARLHAKIYHAVYLALMMILVIKSDSRTGWIDLFLLFCYFGFEWLYIRAGKMERLLTAAVLLLAVLPIMGLALQHLGDIAVALGKSSDLTGRTEIFQTLYPEMSKRPVLGFGYQAFWLGLKGESANVILTPGNSGLGNAENGLLQMWLELGAVGTATAAYLLFMASKNAAIGLARKPSNFVRWNCAIVFLSLLGTLNGDKIMLPDTIEWIFFVIAYVNLASQARFVVACVPERQLAWAS